MLAKVHAGLVLGLTPELIDVEIDISNGLHSFSIIGLPDKAIDEAKDRISAAIKNSGIRSPKKGNKKIVVSLAPADMKKEGTIFDLAIAVSYLLATKEINFDPEKKIFIGELSLNGELRPVKGTLFITKLAKELGFTEIYLPKENAPEASLVLGVDIYEVPNLDELRKKFSGQTNSICLFENKNVKEKEPDKISNNFSDIRGQDGAKRALLISASGRHNIAMYGPPGTGKTMLAKAFREILPDLTFEESIEVTGIHSVSGTLNQQIITRPPLRNPHHTASYVSVVGGGAFPKPGEVTLAHHGVLFLDEFPEFERRVIESLREPLEEKAIVVSRAKGTSKFPANFILVATLNPCPCGKRGVEGKECTCMPSDIERYKRRLSGPIVDRIDMWVEVSRMSFDSLSGAKTGKESSWYKEKVLATRLVAQSRFQNTKIKANGEMSSKDIEGFVVLDESVKKLLNESAEKLDLSARGYHKIIKIAQTIADLDESLKIKESHILEALQYRPKKLIE